MDIDCTSSAKTNSCKNFLGYIFRTMKRHYQFGKIVVQNQQFKCTVNGADEHTLSLHNEDAERQSS